MPRIVPPPFLRRACACAVLVLAMFAVMALAGCVREPYRFAELSRFEPQAPAPLTFDLLVRHAMSLGYVLEGADPMRGVFHVHSRVMGRPARPGRARRRAALRTSLFEVVVQDHEVRVSAIGRNVDRAGAMHPMLAQELEIFTESLRRATHSAGGTAGGIPMPPSSYGPAPMQVAPMTPTTPTAPSPPPIAPEPPPIAPEPAVSPARRLGTP